MKTEDRAMLSEQKISKEEVATFVSHAEAAELEIGNSRFGIGIIMVMACFVGAWGVICLINGIAQTQTIHDLGRSFVTALTGI